MDRYGRQRRSRSHDSHRSRDSHRSGRNRDSQPRAYSGAFRNSKARSRSRSRDRSNRRSRSRDRRRSRSRDRQSRDRHSRRSRRSSSSSSSSSSSDKSMKKRAEERLKQEEELRKKEQESLAARVFVSNLPFGHFTEGDLRHMLDNHGKLKEVNAFIDRGYAFLQFETEADARRAVDESRGSIWKGRNIDIKMALEGRRGDNRDGFNRRPSPPLSGTPPVRPARDRSPIRDDRYLPRDPYLRDREPPIRRDDPYYDDPYRRPLPPDDPYLDRLRDERYRGLPPPPPRRDPYGDPYRDLPPQRPIPPPECTVLLAEEQVRPYGEVIIRKVKASGLVASIAVLPEDRTVPQAVEDMTRRGTLFAIVITSQNEVHSSVTLNILHGQPQEHRNMPLDDAMSLVARSFDRYMQTSREKTVAPSPAPPPVAVAAAPAARTAAAVPFMVPDSGISYLLNLLADNRQLTLAELDKVITYLTERRNRLRGDAPVAESPPAVASARPAIIPHAEDATSKAKQQEAAAIQQRQDLQAKILNLFNGDSSKANPSMASALLSLQGQPTPSLPSVQAPQIPGAQPGGTPNSALINFDNPSVQKALDSLIQNPQVLQNIASVSGPTAGMNTPSMMGMGSQHTHGQAGVAHTSLATGSRQQPVYRGEVLPMQGHAPYGGVAQSNQAARYHHPY